MDEIIEEYVAWMRSWSASERTIKARQTLARSRMKVWGLDGLTVANVTAFLANPDLSRATRCTYHSHLTSFCLWLALAGHIEASPMPDVRKSKRPHGTPRPLSEPEVAKVLSVVEGKTRDWILLALEAGLRAHEIAKISGRDVTPDGIFVLGKGDEVITLPCHSDLWEMAQRYPHSGYWFPGGDDGHMRGQQVSMTVGRLFHAMGISGSIHRCRHVYGTRLLRAGVNVRTVQKLMRHANLDTTANYTAVDEDEMRDAVNLLPSVA